VNLPSLDLEVIAC